MSVMTVSRELGKQICDALGLENVRWLDFHMAVDEISTVTAEFYPEIDGVIQFPAILKKFELVPIEDDGEYGLDGPNDEKISPPQSFINERDLRCKEVA